MKKGAVAMALLLALILLTGCGGSLEKGLQGSWKMTEITYPPAEGIEVIDSLLGSTSEVLQGSVLNWTYTFDHGTFTKTVSVLGFPQTTDGAYAISGSKITITTDDGSDAYTLSVKGSTMTLTDDNGIVMSFTRK